MSEFRSWKPRFVLGVMVMLVTPTALPLSVKVPTSTFVAPRGTASPEKSIIRMVYVVTGPENVAGEVNDTHAGFVNPVISATDEEVIVIVYSAPMRPVGAESRTTGTWTVPPTEGIVKVPVVTVAAVAPATRAQEAARTRARRRNRPIRDGL